MTDRVDVRRAGDRFTTEHRLARLAALRSRSATTTTRATPTSALLLVSNDDVVAPGTGFETHPHRDMEIVTWVLDGALVHQDSEGHNGVIYPGLAQRMTRGHAGSCTARRTTRGGSTGAAPRTDEPVHFVQMWVLPDEARLEPGYEQLDIGAELALGGLVVVASGMPEHRDARRSASSQRDAALHAARLAPGESVHAADGAVRPPVRRPRRRSTSKAPGALGTGDSARITAAEGQRVTAVDSRRGPRLGDALRRLARPRTRRS